jgi:putative colanic acid biosynthesis UDP-glucose lipid carrier transferase
MNRRLTLLLRVSFVVLDLFFINIVFFAVKLYYSEEIPQAFEAQYAYLNFFLNFAWLTVSWMNALYGDSKIYNFERFCKRTIRTFVYFLALIMIYLYFLRQQNISRFFILGVALLIAVGLVFSRLLHFAVFRFLRHSDHLKRRVIIIGHNNTAKKLAQYFEEQPFKTKIIGFCEEDEKVKELSHYPIVGRIKNVIDLSREYNATDIYSTIAPERRPEIYSFMKEADQACIHFNLIPDLESFIRLPVHVEYLGRIPLLKIRKEPLDDFGNRIRKRVFDIFVSTVVVIFILSWLIPLLSIIILLDSKGPIFFIQKRSGLNNKSFNCLKFRSMKVNADSNLKQATKDDCRITKIGGFLRKSNLDEFPQFINVLKGDMSLVGPRPHMLKHTDDYSKLIRQYMVRHFVKPGITGWAQVKGCRGETKTVAQMKDRVLHDIWYMENWSLWLDVRIMLLTVYNSFRGDKNAF